MLVIMVRMEAVVLLVLQGIGSSWTERRTAFHAHLANIQVLWARRRIPLVCRALSTQLQPLEATPIWIVVLCPVIHLMAMNYCSLWQFRALPLEIYLVSTIPFLRLLWLKLHFPIQTM